MKGHLGRVLGERVVHWELGGCHRRLEVALGYNEFRLGFDVRGAAGGARVDCLLEAVHDLVALGDELVSSVLIFWQQRSTKLIPHLAVLTSNAGADTTAKCLADPDRADLSAVCVLPEADGSKVRDEVGEVVQNHSRAECREKVKHGILAPVPVDGR